MMASSFTPLESWLGGLTIGIAAAALLLLNGRILGVSGIARGAMKEDRKRWQLDFLGGMWVGAWLLTVLLPGALDALPATFTVRRAAAAGFLVGLGASLGNGCTSGHGICGLSRLSVRSLAYTLVFMAVGAATAVMSGTVAALVQGGPPAAIKVASVLDWVLSFAIGPAVVLACVGWDMRQAKGRQPGRLSMAVDVLAGIVFALGLGFAGMTQPAKMASFLDVSSPGWDASLAFVMGGAIMVALPAFQYSARPGSRPACTSRFQLPAARSVDARLLLGAVLFGVGWGLAGICPGPGLVVGIVHTSRQLLAWVAGMAAGMWLDPQVISSKLHLS